MKKKSFVWRCTGQVIRHHPWLTLALVVSIAGAILVALLPPLILEVIVNQLTGGIMPTFGTVISYFLFLALAGLCNVSQQSLLTILGQKMTHTLRYEMNQHLLQLPAAYFTVNQPGVIVSRFVNDVNSVETLFAEGIISMIVDAGKVVGIFVVIFTKSLGLAIILALLTPLLYLLTRHFQKNMLKAQIANRQAVGKVNDHVPSTIHTIRMIHTFHAEKYMEDRYDNYIQQSYAAMEKSNFYDAIYSPVIMTCSSLVIAMIMILAAFGGKYQAFFGLSVGSAVAVIAYVNQIFEPLEAIGMEIQNIQAAIAGLYRINEFMDQPSRKGGNETIDPSIIYRNSGIALELKDVTFGYDPQLPVLKNQNLVIKHGENVTLAGRTGAGKSTVFRLLLGLYSPQSGQVLVNGIPADRISDQQKRHLFGYVEQSFHPILGTIGDQITLGSDEFTLDQITAALNLVGLQKRIEELPQKLDTPYDASLFSQGQWQLMAIARSIVADPKILLLDEITANLDSGTEKLVLEALEKAADGRTVLSISHRLYEKTGGRIVHLN